MDKSEKISGAFGVALTLIPLGMQELGMHFPQYVYLAMLVVGGICLVYALLGFGVAAYRKVSKNQRLQILQWKPNKRAIQEIASGINLAKKKSEWASQAPILEFNKDFHKRVEVYEDGKFLGHKTLYWVNIKRQKETPTTRLACKLMCIDIVANAPGGTDCQYPQKGEIILYTEAQGMFQGVELSETSPQQTFYVVSRLEGSETLRIEGFSENDATVEFPCIGNKFRFRIGVGWSGRTFPIKEFLVWVTHEGELKMEFERDL